MQNKRQSLQISAVRKRRSQAKFQKQILECMLIAHILTKGEEKFEKEYVLSRENNLDHLFRSDE